MLAIFSGYFQGYSRDFIGVQIHSGFLHLETIMSKLQDWNKLKVLFPGLELNFKMQFPTKFANSQKELFKNIFMTYCSQ